MQFMSIPDCASNIHSNREVRHVSIKSASTAAALGLVACLNACSLPDTKSVAETRQSAMAHAESLQERLGFTDVWIKKM
jgi:hypothetical protein